jgi:hypothetical protein
MSDKKMEQNRARKAFMRSQGMPAMNGARIRRAMEKYEERADKGKAIITAHDVGEAIKRLCKEERSVTSKHWYTKEITTVYMCDKSGAKCAAREICENHCGMSGISHMPGKYDKTMPSTDMIQFFMKKKYLPEQDLTYGFRMV